MAPVSNDIICCPQPSLPVTSRPDGRADRKRLGAWYTPLSLVRPMVEWAVRSSSDNILDPAVGDGCFLYEAAQRLSSLSRSPGFGRLYGIDVNPDATRVTRISLRDAGWCEQAHQIVCRDFFEIPCPKLDGGPWPFMDAVIGPSKGRKPTRPERSPRNGSPGSMMRRRSF